MEIVDFLIKIIGKLEMLEYKIDKIENIVSTGTNMSARKNEYNINPTNMKAEIQSVREEMINKHKMSIPMQMPNHNVPGGLMGAAMSFKPTLKKIEKPDTDNDKEK